MAIRSQQVSGSGSTGGAARVPGAPSNQPPVPATAPMNGSPSAAAGCAVGRQQQQPPRRESTTNYEVDKTVRVTRNATGAIKRLNAAGGGEPPQRTDAKGKTTTTPLTADDEIEADPRWCRRASASSRSAATR